MELQENPRKPFLRYLAEEVKLGLLFRAPVTVSLTVSKLGYFK